MKTGSVFTPRWKKKIKQGKRPETKSYAELIHKKTRSWSIKHFETNTACQNNALPSIREKMKGLNTDITLKLFTTTSRVVMKTWAK